MRGTFGLYRKVFILASDVVSKVSKDPAMRFQVMTRVAQALVDANVFSTSPTHVYTDCVFKPIRDVFGAALDPWKEEKPQMNDYAMTELLPQLNTHVKDNRDALQAALRLSTAGNTIDVGWTSWADQAETQHSMIQTAIHDVMHDDHIKLPIQTLEAFKDCLTQAKNVLYLVDNCGEIVFDRVLVEQMTKHHPEAHVTVVARHAPVLNDALPEDVHAVGLGQLANVEVMDNGCHDQAPGTILERCSKDFRERFHEADMVVSKGQGNFESLSHVPRASDGLFFALKAKNPMVARRLGAVDGDFVVHRHRSDRLIY